MKPSLIVSTPPHLKNGETAHCLMFDVYIAAIPLIIASTVVFGLRALWIILLCIVTAKLTEIFVQVFFTSRHLKLKDLPSNLLTSEELTFMDGSAAVTGLLMACTLPPGVPYWIPIIGTVVAIVVGKHLFGGIGYNIFNPALVGRAFLLAAWPGIMTQWKQPVAWFGATQAAAVDAVTTATPLAALKQSDQATPLLNLFLGNTGGCIGETSTVALLIGAAYLLYKGTITWHIPLTYIGTVFLLTLILGQDPFLHIFAGGLMLGAFFMATDVVTSPVSKSGRYIFGAGAGIITVLIRQFGGYPEGVCYAILIMNALTPMIERYTSRRYNSLEIDIPLVNKILK
ncbi:MAG: RnfABCDGE type electron transport complex subunit D [Deltaproteobacteria bacterium]|nr:RnfABCDGE type electron transport complex subunit D [Deltaproteobacteria bacterium]